MKGYFRPFVVSFNIEPTFSTSSLNMRTLLFCFSFVFIYLATFVRSQDDAGPYEAKVESIEKCADEGTKDISLMSEYDAEKDTFSGVLYKKKDLGDNIQITIDVQQMVGDDWKKEFSFQYNGICSLIKSAPQAMQNLLEALHFRDCPIPEGTNILKDMKNSFKMPFVTSMRYGRRQSEIILTDMDGNRLGCVLIKGNIIPVAA